MYEFHTINYTQILVICDNTYSNELLNLQYLLSEASYSYLIGG